MKREKRSVAVVVRPPGEPDKDEPQAPDQSFLIVRRPEDPDDALGGVWALPAVTRLDGEDEAAAVSRAGLVKLGAQIFVEDNSSKRLAPKVPPVVVRRPRTVLFPRLWVTETGEDAAAPDYARAAAFAERAGVPSLIDVHTHFMPERLLAAVWKYFDAAGPLVGRPWPIAYKLDEQGRVDALRKFGVTAFTALLYPHKPGMARSLNDWGADFAARTPGCLQSATFFAEPSAGTDVRRALETGARVFKVHLQVGDFDPNDPLLDEAWGLLAEAGVPVVTHCGSGPVAGQFTGPGPVARLMARHPRLRLVVAHLGMPEYAGFLDLTERHPGILLDTTMAFTPFVEDGPDGTPFPPAEMPRLRDLGDRVLLGTDFPNIPYTYPDALEAMEGAGLGTAWLRAVCHDNAARIFGC